MTMNSLILFTVSVRRKHWMKSLFTGIQCSSTDNSLSKEPINDLTYHKPFSKSVTVTDMSRIVEYC